MSEAIRCSNCFQIKPADEFYPRRIKLPNGQVKHSHQSRCKPCNTEVCRGFRERLREKARKQAEPKPKRSDTIELQRGISWTGNGPIQMS